ncbi:hypothetical protein [Acuticoccus mangrovi]|uniref:Uncharacterized protein n=1 Tax=Acuticoccus mangrovi TaxID=2796142 RepID=A0A934INK1_9HYPH|nr:hypothetical protein [Acuticoccus mangrovi]MBJ3774684.1 hypothetical protein [Acuticoccus mangrovi]
MRSVILALLLTAATPAAAFEATGNVVADALLGALERGGYQNLAAQSVDRSGSAIVIEGVTGTGPGTVEGATTDMTIDTITISSGIVDADNTLIADRVVYSGTRLTEAGTDSTSSVDTLTVDGLRLTSDSTTSGLMALLGSFDTLSVSGISAAAPEGRSIIVDAISATVDERDVTEATSGSLSVTGLRFDTAMWTEPARSQIQSLGYDTLDIDLSAAGRWEADGGRTTIRDLTLSAADFGKLSLKATVSGLTGPLMQSLQASAGDFAVLVAALQNVVVYDLSLSYLDEGFADRLVDQTVTRNNVPREALVEQLVGMLPTLLEPIGDPALLAATSEATRSFLTDPKRITLSITPDTPPTVAQILAAGLMGPQALPRLLNLEIHAGE